MLFLAIIQNIAWHRILLDTGASIGKVDRTNYGNSRQVTLKRKAGIRGKW